MQRPARPPREFSPRIEDRMRLRSTPSQSSRHASPQFPFGPALEPPLGVRQASSEDDLLPRRAVLPPGDSRHEHPGKPVVDPRTGDAPHGATRAAWWAGTARSRAARPCGSRGLESFDGLSGHGPTAVLSDRLVGTRPPPECGRQRDSLPCRVPRRERAGLPSESPLRQSLHVADGTTGAPWTADSSGGRDQLPRLAPLPRRMSRNEQMNSLPTARTPDHTPGVTTLPAGPPDRVDGATRSSRRANRSRKPRCRQRLSRTSGRQARAVHPRWISRCQSQLLRL